MQQDDWDINPDNYLKDEEGNFVLRVDGTPRKKSGRAKGSKAEATRIILRPKLQWMQGK